MKSLLKTLTNAFDDFKLIEINKDHVYKTSTLNLFKSDYVIRTQERDVKLNKAKDEIKLLSSSSIENIKLQVSNISI